MCQTAAHWARIVLKCLANSWTVSGSGGNSVADSPHVQCYDGRLWEKLLVQFKELKLQIYSR